MSFIGIKLAITQAVQSAASAFSIANSFLLDGVSEYFTFSSILANVSTNTSGTISAMVNPSSVTGTTYIVGLSNGALADWILIRNIDGKVSAYVIKGGGNAWILTTDNVVLTNGVWTNIDVVQDGVNPEIYIDGVLVSQTFTSSVDKTAWFNGMTLNYAVIGAAYPNGSYSGYFNGYISLGSVLNTNLNSTQISDSYNSGKPKSPQDLYGVNCEFTFNPDNSGSTAQFSVVDSINSITATSVNLEDADKTIVTPY